MAEPALDIAVNLTWLAPGRVGGSEEYLVRQLTGIADGHGRTGDDRSGRPLRLHLYCQPQFARAYDHLTGRIDTSVMPITRDSRGLRIAAEHTWLAARTRTADVVHHGGGTAPLAGRRPVVLTVHDLQYLTHPTYFSAARRRYLAALMPRSVRRAAVVATPSDYVRGTVVEAFDIEPDRVVVVRHGVPDIAPPDADVSRTVAERYDVRRPYLVYAAITHPHKGHRLLVDMLASTADAGHPLHDHQLVLLGGAGDAEPDLAAAIRRSGLGDRVVRTGRVPSDHRDALVAGADALVFPSEYEGFGAPLVEAMALGVPVVAGDHPAIVEVVGDAGVIVSDRRPASWADAVLDAIERRDALVAAGRRRRDAFTIAASGADLGGAYRLAQQVGGSRAPS